MIYKTAEEVRYIYKLALDPNTVAREANTVAREARLARAGRAAKARIAHLRTYAHNPNVIGAAGKPLHHETAVASSMARRIRQHRKFTGTETKATQALRGAPARVARATEDAGRHQVLYSPAAARPSTGAAGARSTAMAKMLPR